MLKPSWVQSLAQRQPVTPPPEPQPGPACAVLPEALLGWPSSAPGRGSPEPSSLGPGRGPSNHGVSDPAGPAGQAGWLAPPHPPVFSQVCSGGEAADAPRVPSSHRRGSASHGEGPPSHGSIWLIMAPGQGSCPPTSANPSHLFVKGQLKLTSQPRVTSAESGGTAVASLSLCFHVPAGLLPGGIPPNPVAGRSPGQGP